MSRVFLQTGHSPQRRDWLAGAGGLELTNVIFKHALRNVGTAVLGGSYRKGPGSNRRIAMHWRLRPGRLERRRRTRSPEAVAAVHVHDLAGHVAGSVGDEELRDCGDVLGVAHAADQRALGDLA